MFLTEEENRKLTQVGAGTPGGALLRRYWHPVAGLHQLTEEAPTAHVRILGEDLVLFRDKSGRIGLLADHCPHRGASLLYGRVEERGIACAYHGWLYDTQGNCLETPAEPADSNLYLTVKHKAYPVEKYLGLYWAYLGPAPVPHIRQLDVGAYPINGIREMAFSVNWVQIMENHMDLTHGYILHQDTGDAVGRKASGVPNTTRGRIDSLTFIRYEELPFGLSREAAPNDDENGLLVFPNMLRRSNQVQIHVPVDDTHTRTFKLSFSRSRDLPQADDGVSDQEPVDYYILQPGEAKGGTGLYPDVRYRMDVLTGQDVMAIETQGAVAPRPDWRLATGDRGVEMFDRILTREMDRVQEGNEPMALVKDPDEIIDTDYEAYTHNPRGGSQQYPREGLQVYARAGAHRA